MRGAQGRIVRNRKFREGRVIFQKHLASFTVLKAHCHTQTFILSLFFCSFQGSFLLPVAQTIGYVFICPFCAPHHYTNTIFDQCRHRRLFCLLPQLHLWPRWLSKEPTSRRPHHNCHCFHSVTSALTSQDLTSPQSPSFPHTISPNCHNQGVSVCSCLLSHSLSTVFDFLFS